MHGHGRHNTTVLSIIHHMSTTCFGQYYFWPSSGWIQLSEKTGCFHLSFYSTIVYKQALKNTVFCLTRKNPCSACINQGELRNNSTV